MEDYYSMFRERKVCILVPTYNNCGTLEGVLRGLLTYTDQIIVVDDGSTDQTPDILKDFEGITTLTFPVNRGKGAGLREGFSLASAMGYDYAISIDSDGQHFADDIMVFVRALEKHPGKLLVGARNMDQVNVPGKSNFGRKFSNFWFHFETGIRLQDTQSGYRLYPLRQLSQMRFFTTKFEFEIEVLVRAAWKRIPIIEVPVRVLYQGEGTRVSHFRPFRDFARISVLNTVLVILALFYYKPRALIHGLSRRNLLDSLSQALTNRNEKDTVKAVSVGFGVFMGIFPIWGFQLAVAILLAFLFRLNKILVILAANISIPPVVPIILFLSHWVGGVWMGDRAVTISLDENLDLAFLQNSLVQYLTGAVTLSVVCGILFGLLAYGALKIIPRAHTPEYD